MESNDKMADKNKSCTSCVLLLSKKKLYLISRFFLATKDHKKILLFHSFLDKIG